MSTVHESSVHECSAWVQCMSAVHESSAEKGGIVHLSAALATSDYKGGIQN
jgi:hypothetical protein